MNVNPISILVDGTRGLMEGDPDATDIGITLAVAAGLTAVFAPLTSHLYRRGWSPGAVAVRTTPSA